ncbi:hypothetical protein [Pseudomonas sp. CCI1.1]|uniref:hypothetical protein n=1 Tax=Pseudomonas sp. CCI1.1 TaxID=3048613 RepID=UPI002AC8E43C|nr:hypothetical protein [Pseudomonas sp. CCI1.1]MEB0194657.1 hypothetical protein [Pseudomonas sp. CCI1.1]WPX48423.1 hypothetical protein RHM69_29670 [Pseudomonas sp. CCI1.1]
MTDQTQRLEIATVRAEIGSNITYKFNNDALDAAEIPTDSGPIPNLKQVIRDIKEEALDETLRAELFAAAGAGMVGFDPALSYPQNTVGSAILYNRRKTVKSYGAVGDGITNDTAKVLQAITDAGENGIVVFDSNAEYLVNGGSLIQLTGQQWVGGGGQRSTRLKKASNGDLVRMGNLAAISDITLNNNGENFTGRGIYIPSGFSQTLFRVRSVRSKGPSLEFAVDAGGGCNVVAFEGDTIDQDTVGAIKFAGDTGPHPRLLNGIWLSGGFLDIASPGAGNGCSMSNFYIRNIKTVGPVATGTALMHFSNGRFATIADTTVLSGSDITLVGVAFSGPVLLQNMQGLRSEACTFGAGITEDAATCRFNSYSDQTKTFSPTWSQASGSQPSIGNGSLTGKYTRQGFLVKFEMTLTVGSTTTFGNSSGPYLFSLPVGGSQNSAQNFLAGWCFDASASTDFPVNGQIASGTNTLTISRNGAGVRDGFPFSWAAGDSINVSICYMAI